METRKTIAIFSSCQRPTSPGNGFLLLPLFGFLQRKMVTYHGDNLILSRSRLLLQSLFLIHLRVGAHSEVKTLTFFRNANPPIELLPKGPLLGNCQALSKCQNHKRAPNRFTPNLSSTLHLQLRSSLGC